MASDDRVGLARNRAYSVYPGDKKLMEWMQEQLGAKRSDVIRMALRYQAQLLDIEFPEVNDAGSREV